MSEYTLLPQEVELYKGEVVYGKSNNTTLVLTNQNIIIIKRTKKWFSKEQVEVEEHPIDTLKIYKDEPQVKVDGTDVEMFFVDCQKVVSFCNKKELNIFVDAIYELMTGKKKFERGVQKVGNAINTVDDALGIKTIDTIATFFQKGIKNSLIGGFIQRKDSDVENGDTMQNGAPQCTISDEQIEMLRKLKGLLDAGILTDEEFEQKKKEVLGM